MSNRAEVKKAGVAAPASVHSNQPKAEVSTMNNASVVITQAFVNASRNIRYPGPWVDYKGERLNEFLLKLMDQPAVADTTPYGRLFFRSPIREAMGAIPYLYRNASQQIIGQHFYKLLIEGASDLDPERLIREMHDRLSMMRSAISGTIRADFDEFAEGTTPIEVAHQHAWQTEVSDVDSGAAGSTVWASCSVDQVVGDFADALGKGELNWASSLLMEMASRHMETVDWDGWDRVALDLIPTLVEVEKTRTNSEGLRVTETVKENKRKKAKDQLTNARQRFWGVNKVFRQLVKIQWRMESSLEYWSYRLERATTEEGRPHSEAYAGSDPEVVEIGRIQHIVADEGYDGTGSRAGEPEQEVLRLISSELDDLRELLDMLETLQRRFTPIWRVIGNSGVPYWYNRNGQAFSVDEKAEAKAAKEMQTAEWLKNRDVVAAQKMDPRVAKLLAEMADFESIE